MIGFGSTTVPGYAFRPNSSEYMYTLSESEPRIAGSTNSTPSRYNRSDVLNRFTGTSTHSESARVLPLLLDLSRLQLTLGYPGTRGTALLRVGLSDDRARLEYAYY
eukprot:770934-Rhodomonas_salina.2